MAIIDVKKISAIVLKKDTRKLLKKLQTMGILEISRVRASEQALYGLQENQQNLMRTENALAEVRAAIEVVTRYNKTKTPFLAPKPEISMAALESQEENMEQIHSAIEKAGRIDEAMGDIRQRHMKTVNAISQLKPFMRMDVPVEELRSTKHVKFRTGYIPNESIDQLGALTEKFDGLFYVETLEDVGGFLSVFLAMHKTVADEARSALREVGFNEVRLEGFLGTVTARIDKLNEKLDELEREREKQEEKAAQIAASRMLLQAYEESLAGKLERETAYANLGSTSSVNIIEGYIRCYDADKLEKAISEVTDAYCLTVSDPEEDDDAPTVIENNKLLTPFEGVTDMYSVPSRKGIDPVYILAPFYFMFFGMMLSDAAYGILLSIGAMVVLFCKKPEGMFKKVVGVLAICGVSTLIWGAMFGGWMGFETQPILLNPMNEPLNMLILCLAVGYLHLLVSLGAGFYSLAKQGHFWDGLFDKGFWMIVLLAVPVFFLDSTAAAVTAIVGFVGLLLTQGRHKKGFFRKVIGGLSSLYDVTGYLSDLLSYIRIFGMALATAVIGMVFNQITEMLMTNIIGYLFGAVVFVVGHVFNLAINALGAYVHSARLQYIESFNKFFEGGGRAFRPLAYRTKNFRIQSGEPLKK